jgi:hypothetical protein
MKAFLTIPETCVWAATRRPEAVDAMTARAREGVHALLDPEGADDAPSEYLSAWEAFKALDDLCAAGEITMHGIEHGVGASGPIPADAWAKLALVTVARWGLVAARRGSELLDPDARWWNNLTIRSADALKVWPSPMMPSEPLPLPCGAGNKPYDDAELAARVLASIKNGEYKSPRAATRAIMDIIPGHGDPQNKARRLADKVRKVARAK